MSQAGGSATINGVLYQIFGSLDRAINIQLHAKREGEDLVEATLIIEPSKGGGDIHVLTPSKWIVEQWKAKSSHGAWSLTKIIKEVFPDLYLAVNIDNLGDDSEYRFVTEGHQGKWKEAKR